MGFFTRGSIIMDYGLVFYLEAMIYSHDALIIDLFLTNTEL